MDPVETECTNSKEKAPPGEGITGSPKSREVTKTRRKFSRARSHDTEKSAASTASSSRRSNAPYEVDTGWSWVVLGAFFVITMIMVGFVRSYGIFFVEMQDRYDASASEISLVGSLWSAFFSITAIFVVTFVLDVMSERQSILLGMTLMTAAAAFSCMVTSFPVYLFTLGALVGVGSGFAYGPGFVLLGKYFRRHLTLATAIANTGVSIGSLTMPILISITLEEFVFPSGLLIIAAILAQTLICACLMRPARQIEAGENIGTDGADSDSGFEENGIGTGKKDDVKFEIGCEGKEGDCGDKADSVKETTVDSHVIKVNGDFGGDGLNICDKLKTEDIHTPARQCEVQANIEHHDKIDSDLKAREENLDSNNHITEVDAAENCEQEHLLKREDDPDNDPANTTQSIQVPTGRCKAAAYGNQDTLNNKNRDSQNHDNACEYQDEIQETGSELAASLPKDQIKLLGSLGEGPSLMLMNSFSQDPDDIVVEKTSIASETEPVLGDENQVDEEEARDMLLDMFEEQVEPRLIRTYSDSIQVVHNAVAPTLPLTCSLQHVSADVESPTQQVLQMSFIDKLATANIVEFVSVPDLLSVSMPSLHHTQKYAHRRRRRRRRRSKQPRSPWARLCYLCCGRFAKVFDVSICRNIVFWMLMVYQFFGVLAGNLITAFLPPLAREKTLTDRQGALLLTLIGALDIFSRLLPGFVAHYNLAKPSQMVLISLVVLGVVCQFASVFNTFPTMVAFSVVVGCFSGVFISMTQAVAIQFLGLKRFPVTFGFVMLTNGISMAVGYPIMGALKDATGTYETSFQFMGATQLMAAVLLALLPFLSRVQRRRDEKEQGEQPDNVQTVAVPLTSPEAQT